MPRLEEASHRLQVAIDNLERVVAARAAKGGSGGAAGGKSDDDSALRDALEAARQENARLQEVAGTVSQRLDATIGRLRRLVS